MNTHRNILNKPGKKENRKSPTLTPQPKFETKKIEPKEQIGIEFYDEKVKISRRNKDHKFLNHLNRTLIPENEAIVLKFKNDLKALHSFFEIDPEERNLDKRLREIFSLYVDADDLDKLKGNIYKARIKDEVGMSTGFRIFIFKDFAEEKYKIFLLDPLHLVIPSRVQYRENTYINNRGNGVCISSLF